MFPRILGRLGCLSVHRTLLLNQRVVPSFSPLSRLLSSKSDHTPAGVKLHEQASEDKFQLVFRFPHVHILAFICRLKVYQTFFTVFGFAPSVLYLYSNGQVSEQFVQYSLGAAIVSVNVLFLFGEYFRKFIGIVYLNKDTEEVKISHITFWGKRGNFIVPLEEIVPVSETTENVNSPVWKVYFYDKALPSMVISTTFGSITQPKEFKYIFGNEASPLER